MVSLSSYSKNEWGKLLANTAYRGFKVNEISQRFKEGYECTFENDHLINLISSTGHDKITVDMNDVMKKHDHLTLSRLFHNFRMLFSCSAYAKEFNERIAKLAEILTINARKQDFHNRCQANLGNFATLPTDIYDQIIYARRIKTDKDKIDCFNLMKMFWKAPLGSKVICNTIDLKKFANWVNKKHHYELCHVLNLNLKNHDLEALFPSLEYLYIRSIKFNFNRFDVVGTCNKLSFLEISSSDNLIDDHFQYIFNLPNLKDLNIYNCSNFTDEGLKWITGPNKLSSLDLINSKITGEGLRSIKKLTNLTHLNLYRCNNVRENESVKHLAELTRLESLSLTYTGLKKEGFKHLEKLPSLSSLFVGEIMDEDLEPIGKIANLRELSIADSHFTGSGLQYLTKLSNFQALDLRRCSDITNDNLNYIMQIKNFNYLHIASCQNLTRPNFEKPGIEIKWSS
jgi:hypothetical protein